jgi:hypothetical protein
MGSMNPFYLIFFGIFTLGFVLNGMNSSGILPTALPTSNTNSFTQTQITDLTNSTQGQANLFTFTPQLTIIFISFLAGMMSLLTIIPLLLQLGIPAYLALMIQGPIWFIELFGVWGIITGQKPEMGG